MGDDVVVRFVTDPNQKPSDVAQEAFEAVKTIGEESGSLVEWFEGKFCEEIVEKSKKYIYIFEKFEGRWFEHVRSTGNRIYGPICVLTCLKEKEALPKSAHPIFSLAMKGLTISCTSVEKTQRDQIHQKVLWMYGDVSKDFHEKVTHLVAGEVGSKKYIVAADLKKHIMSPEWVDSVWVASHYKFVKASDPQLLKQYHCPLFLGFVITVSGLDSTERSHLKHMIEAEGGRYSGEMKINECTHLIINNPKGQKYEFAKKWKIHIVNSNWVSESIKIGYCLEEGKFPVGEEGADVQKHSHSTPILNTGRTSSISSNLSVISMTHIDETAFNITGTSVIGGGHEGGGAPTPTTARVLDEFNVNACKVDMSLDGCKIFLSGFTGPQLEKLRKLINLGGGTRFSSLNESVSHVIIGEPDEQHIEQLKAASFRPHIVRVEWLLESCKSGQCLPEHQFVADVGLPSASDAPPTVKKQRPSSSSRGSIRTPAATGSRSSADATVTEKDADHAAADDMADIMSQYMQPPPLPSPGASDMTDESALMRAAEAGEAAGGDDEVTMKLDHHAAEGGPDEELPIFSKKTFLVVGFAKADEEQLGQMIEEYGGRVVGALSRGVPDYGVVPLLGHPIERTVNEVVTNAWLQMCLESNTVFPPSSDEFFQPLDIKSNMRPLEGCILSISGYTGTLRDVLQHLTELIGGTVQDYFVKVAKPKQGLKASTHLIVNSPTGSKYLAAKKWKIPAVHKQWILDSAKTGVKQEEKYYFLENPDVRETSLLVDRSRDEHNSTLQHNKSETSHVQNMSIDDVNNSTKEVVLNDNEQQMDTDGSCLDKENHNAQHTMSSDQPTPKNNVSILNQVEPISAVATGKAVNQRVKALQLAEAKSPKAPPKHQTPKSSLMPGVETPSKFLDPSKDYVPKWDLAAAYAMLETPEALTPKGKHIRRPSTPLGELLKKQLAIAVKNSELAPAPAAGPMDLADADDMPASQAEGPLRGVVIATAKKLINNQSEYNNIAASLGADYRWTYDATATHYIFVGKQNDMNKEFRKARDEGKIIVSPHWLLMCQEQNCRVDESLFPHTYNPNMSLSISTTKTPQRSSRSTRAALRSAPDSPETVTLPLPTPKAERTKSTTSLPDDSKTSATEEPSLPGGGDASSSKTAGRDEEEKRSVGGGSGDSLVEGLKTLMANASKKTRGSRGSLKRAGSFDSPADDPPSSSKRTRKSKTNFSPEPEEDVPVKRGRMTRATSKRKTGHTGDTQMEPSQRIEVTWDDPAAREQQELLAPDLAKHSESFSPTHLRGDDPEEEEEMPAPVDPATPVFARQYGGSGKRHKSPKSEDEKYEKPATPRGPSIAFPLKKKTISPPKPIELLDDPDETRDIEAAKPKPLVLMSGLKPDERIAYAAVLEGLGGEVLEAAHFDNKCTHLIVAAPTRNEKYLASVAAGKWVVHKSWVESCQREAALVDEAAHEWGATSTRALLKSSSMTKLAEAAQRWRRKVHEARLKNPNYKGAFEGWKVILLTDAKKEEGFKRLLQAGGAVVLATKPPFTNLSDVTHAFIDMNKLKFTLDVDQFLRADIACLKPEFIAGFLMDDPLPSHCDYYITEVSGSDARKRKNSNMPETPSKKTRR